MAMTNPTTRANYEPNSWGDEGGPREDPDGGFASFAETMAGDKRRIRPDSFADHFSQARQFYASQTPVEQQHMVDALVFELSKVELPRIRERVVAQLRNVDEDLATQVADGLGMELPTAIEPARPTRTDLAPSPALSIVENGPDSFAGRRIGVLVSEGADAKTLRSLQRAADGEGAELQLVGPKRAGVADSEGNELTIAELVDGGPSVLFDAVAIVLSADGASTLVANPAARDFVSDAHAHCKFIACGPNADVLLEAAGLGADMRDDGYLALADTRKSAEGFVESCRRLRFWDRQL